MPAPAVASLYLNGNGSRMLTPERALFQTAVHLTWPRALTDDDEYLACQISELLLEEVERPGIDRNLPRCVQLQLATRSLDKFEHFKIARCRIPPPVTA
jgi:hypothetical protein